MCAIQRNRLSHKNGKSQEECIGWTRENTCWNHALKPQRQNVSLTKLWCTKDARSLCTSAFVQQADNLFSENNLKSNEFSKIINVVRHKYKEAHKKYCLVYFLISRDTLVPCSTATPFLVDLGIAKHCSSRRSWWWSSSTKQREAGMTLRRLDWLFQIEHQLRFSKYGNE